MGGCIHDSISSVNLEHTFGMNIMNITQALLSQISLTRETARLRYLIYSSNVPD